MVFMLLVVIGQFCRDLIGRHNAKVAVIGWLLFYRYFRSVYCLLRSARSNILLSSHQTDSVTFTPFVIPGQDSRGEVHPFPTGCGHAGVRLVSK